MALIIKTEEVDRLARSRKAHGQTITEAVTTALRERLLRERVKREAIADLPARIAAFSRPIHDAYDTGPVTKAEWDAASGDQG